MERNDARETQEGNCMKRDHSKEKILIRMDEEQRSKQDLDKETEGNANKENRGK